MQYLNTTQDQNLKQQQQILKEEKRAYHHSRKVAVLTLAWQQRSGAKKPRNTDECSVLLQSHCGHPRISLSLSLSLSPSLPPYFPSAVLSLFFTSHTIISTLQHTCFAGCQLQNQFHLPVQAENVKSTPATVAPTAKPVIITTKEVQPAIQHIDTALTGH